MYKGTKDGKGLIELSLKQREQYLAYTFDRLKTDTPRRTSRPTMPIPVITKRRNTLE